MSSPFTSFVLALLTRTSGPGGHGVEENLLVCMSLLSLVRVSTLFLGGRDESYSISDLIYC